MLAKIITWGHDRPEAIRKMDRALRELVVLGVTTNAEYLRAILAAPAFIAGHTPTSFLADHLAGWQPATELDDGEWVAAAVWEVVGMTDDGRRTAANEQQVYDPWAMAANWRNVG